MDYGLLMDTEKQTIHAIVKALTKEPQCVGCLYPKDIPVLILARVEKYFDEAKTGKGRSVYKVADGVCSKCRGSALLILSLIHI